MNIVFGSSLAALVAVSKLSEDSQVIWVKPNQSVGGHFAGVEVDGIFFDLGMVINEPYSLPAKNRQIGDRPPAKTERVSYVHMNFSWLESIGIEFEPISIFIYFKGVQYPDFMISDNLEILLSFSNAEKEKMLEELTNIINSINTLHPSTKNNSEFYIQNSYSTVLSKSSSSKITQLLIDPWLNKMKKNLSQMIPAIEHRSIWAPLYYPETILAVLSEEIQPNSLERPFWVPKNRSINQLIREIQSGFESKIEIISNDNNQLDSLLKNTLFSKKYFYGSSKDYLQMKNLTSEELVLNKRSISLVIGTFNSEIPINRVINFIDEDILAYRITLRTLLGSSITCHTFVIEFGEAGELLSDSVLSEMTLSIFPKIGISGTIKVRKILKTTLPIIDSDFLLQKNKDNALQTEELRKDGWLGSIIDFGSSSFNDQVLLGLWDSHG
jgi:hypothetical protein